MSPGPRVCFLVPTLSPSGGMAVVRGHAERLRRVAGMDTELVLTEGAPPGRPAGDVPVRTLEEARRERYDVAVATWWTTAESAWSLDTARHVLFVQGPDMRMYRDDEPFQRLRAMLPLGMPFEFVTVSASLARLVEAVRPGTRARVVPNGVDKEVFAPAADRPPPARPLRILVDGTPRLWFKGVGDALAAAALMREPRRVTLVGPEPIAQDQAPEGVDRVAGGLEPAAMAALYRDHDVVVKLSRFEGLGLVPIEAFHVGTPCVVTPYGGHEEYVRHGENGIVAGFDDLPGTAGWLDALARDRQLLRRLGEGAVATAARWPDPAAATERLAEVLSEPAPPPRDDAFAAILAAEGEYGAATMRHLRGTNTWLSDALDEAREHVAHLYAETDRYAELLADARAQLAEAQRSVGYRIERKLRRGMARLPWR